MNLLSFGLKNPMKQNKEINLFSRLEKGLLSQYDYPGQRKRKKCRKYD